jgi:DNA-directed RNA polymerase subunit RPC12/RpoP
MKKYYCDICGKEMARHHIVKISFTGKERDKEYEKELCDECFHNFLEGNKMKE